MEYWKVKVQINKIIYCKKVNLKNCQDVKVCKEGIYLMDQIEEIDNKVIIDWEIP